MVFKLIAKLLFKATVPLLLIAGVFSYGLYSRGGDPIAMWKGFGTTIMDQLASQTEMVKDDATTAAEVVSSVASGDTKILKSKKSKRTQVFTWKDANGVTQYSSIAPSDSDSRKMSVNPNINVMAPVLAPKAVKTARAKSKETRGDSGSGSSENADKKDRDREKDSEFKDPAVQDVADQLDGELPGIVGQILSTQGDGKGGALNPAQLMKMLQQK